MKDTSVWTHLSHRRTVAMDFVLSGVAACGACLFTNPLEVVKTRMQLQGELQSRGTYQVYYRNVFHAFYTIGKVDGLAGLQKGLAPGLVYQFFMNGVRLGSYAIIESYGYIHTEGRVSALKTTLAGAVAGVVGAVMGSPVYLVSFCVISIVLHRCWCDTWRWAATPETWCKHSVSSLTGQDSFAEPVHLLYCSGTPV